VTGFAEGMWLWLSSPTRLPQRPHSPMDFLSFRPHIWTLISGTSSRGVDQLRSIHTSQQVPRQFRREEACFYGAVARVKRAGRITRRGVHTNMNMSLRWTVVFSHFATVDYDTRTGGDHSEFSEWFAPPVRIDADHPGVGLAL